MFASDPAVQTESLVVIHLASEARGGRQEGDASTNVFLGYCVSLWRKTNLAGRIHQALRIDVVCPRQALMWTAAKMRRGIIGPEG